MGVWTNAETAIYTWAVNALKAANGAVAVPVWWTHQSMPRSGKPFATLKRSGTVALGTVDEFQLKPNPAGSPPAGQELEYDTNAQREFTVSLQVFTVGVTGDADALALVESAQIALNQESYASAFAIAGVVVAGKGTVQNIASLLETKYEGRAVLDVRFRVGVPATDYSGYIATAQTTGTFQP